MRPGMHRYLLWFNWLAVLVCAVGVAWLQQGTVSVVLLAMLVLPAAASLTPFSRKHWSELAMHFAITTTLFLGFLLEWSPPVSILLLIAYSVSSIVFLSRPWGGWHLSYVVAAVLISLALNMTGHGEKSDFETIPQTLLIVGTTILVCVNAYVVAQHSKHTSREAVRAKELIENMQEVQRQFAEAIFEAPNLREALWRVTELCIPALGFEDCVIYMLDEKKKELEQVAAYGPKSLSRGEILSPIRIPYGEGIVGKVAESGTPMIVGDTTETEDYILDDDMRYSEMAVPILFEGKVFGVIDSEHREKYFFTEDHLTLFQIIAALCSNKIAALHLTGSEEEKAAALRALSQLNEKQTSSQQWKRDIAVQLREPLDAMEQPLEALKASGEKNTDENLRVLSQHRQRLAQLIADLEKTKDS